MAVIKSNVATASPNGLILDTFIYPNQYASVDEKHTPEWLKKNMDYWNAIAFSQYQNNKGIIDNYKLLAGEFDFTEYSDADIDPILDALRGSQNSDAPKHLKHYPIVNSPINTLLGELIKRPDSFMIKATDEDSKNQYIAVKESLIKQAIEQKIQAKYTALLAGRGVDVTTEEGSQQLQSMSMGEIEEYMRKSYSDIGEQWATKKIRQLKDYLYYQEKSEDGFKNLLVCSGEYFETLPDKKASLGIRFNTLNPALVWKLGHPNMKFADEAYAIGWIDRLDISQIVAMFDLTEEEIEHLIQLQSNNGFGPNNLDKGSGTGINSIHYNTYNPLAYRNSILNPDIVSPDKKDPFTFNLGGTYGNSAFQKFIVVKSYWQSKRKHGKFTYFDEDGNKQSEIVDENFETYEKPIFYPWVKKEDDKIAENLISGELVEWGYENEWYEGLKIGGDIYKGGKLPLNQCPITGLIHNNLNATPNSLLGLMKPLQSIYNVLINQLFELLGKEMGNVQLVSLRHIPQFKDLGDEDALAIWEENARSKGIVFVNDSPENTQGSSSFNQWTNIDLTRSQEMQTRYDLAQRIKLECWELVGINKERLGSVAATQTATGTDAALRQSYSQTEPYFRAHETVMQRTLQLLLDTAKWVEVQNPVSLLSHVNSDFENEFIKMTSEELMTKNLMIFVTNSGKDLQLFNSLQRLAEAALQNGSDFVTVMELYAAESKSQIKNIFQKQQAERQAREQQAQEIEQQKVQQAQEATQAQLAQAEKQHKETIENENYNKELDRINKKEIALIGTFSRQEDNMKDNNMDGIPDILEITRLDSDIKATEKEHDIKLRDIDSKNKQHSDKISVEKEKLKLEKEKILNEKAKMKIEADLEKKNMVNDLAIARQNRIGRNKPTKK